MMIPLRRSLIVKEHATLPYPEGTACASVLIAGEKGGDLARTAYQGLGFAFVYALLQKVVRFIAETPTLALRADQPLPAGRGAERRHHARVPGRRLHHRPAHRRRAGGGRRARLAGAHPAARRADAARHDRRAAGEARLPRRASTIAGGPGGWDPATHAFADTAAAVYRAYVRQIGAGAVAAGGFITLLKTLPTIVSSFQREHRVAAPPRRRRRRAAHRARPADHRRAASARWSWSW